MSAINTLSISGFRSMRKLDKLHLSNFNVLIGSNGAGKSDFAIFFSCVFKREWVVSIVTTPATPLTQAYQCGFFYV